MHVVWPPVTVAVGAAAAACGPLPFGALAGRTAGGVEHAPHTDCQKSCLRFRVRLLGHGTHIDIVLLQAGIRIAQHDPRQFLGVRTFQVLRHGRRIGQPFATARLELPNTNGVCMIDAPTTAAANATAAAAASSATTSPIAGHVSLCFITHFIFLVLLQLVQFNCDLIFFFFVYDRISITLGLLVLVLCLCIQIRVRCCC